MQTARDTSPLEGILRRELPRIRELYGVESLALFGTYVRGEAGPESDLEVLVRFRRSPGLLRYIELENCVSELLGGGVDLVMAEALKPNIGQRPLAAAQPV